MKVMENAKLSFKDLDEGMCFMWCEKYFMKVQTDATAPWRNAIRLEDGHVYGFKDGEVVTLVNAVLNVS